MKKLPTNVKMVEMAIYVACSTVIMTLFELWLWDMPALEVLKNRIAQGGLNASSILAQDTVRRVANGIIGFFRLRRVADGVMNGNNPISEATRTLVAVGELIVAQVFIYLPIMLLCSAHDITIVKGLAEIGTGCAVLWTYHHAYAWLYRYVVRPAFHSARRFRKRTRRIRDLLAQKGARIIQ